METGIYGANKVGRVNNILQKTIQSIDSSKEEILEIVEYSRKECIKLEEELNEIRFRVDKVIEEVDALEIEERRSRINLSRVSKNFDINTENDIKDAYDKANELRIALLLKREEEKVLREKREEKEFNLKSAIEVYEKIEQVGKTVGVASEFLKGNLDEIIDTVDDLNKRQLLGIKVIEVQEEERKRLARDIHDGAAQSIANILLKAELCEKLINMNENRAIEELQNLKTITKDTLNDIRKTIYDLRPMSLDDLGLIPTLKRYIYDFNENTWINVELNIVGEPYELEPAIEVAIFRIIQESLNNIVKHSKASNAMISIEFLIDKIKLVISDNGIGFDMEEINNTHSVNEGFGLISIRERTELLQGEFDIKSTSNSGTRLIVSIPLIEEEKIYGE